MTEVAQVSDDSQVPLIRDQRVHDAIHVGLFNDSDGFALFSLAPLQRPCKELKSMQ
jgi:hypothetical protein